MEHKKPNASAFLVVFLMSLPFCNNLFPQTGSPNEITNLSGYEFSLEQGILSKISTVKKLDAPSEENTRKPVYAKPLLTKRTGLKLPSFSGQNKPSTINYGFHGHIFGGMNIPFASTTDSNGNLYITGGSSSEQAVEGNFTTIKIDAAGNKVWEIRQPGTEYVVEYGMEITLDDSGNPIVSGVSWNGNDMDLSTIKYNAQTGDVIWQTNYDGNHQGLDAPAAITTDTNGNVFVTGISYTGTNVAFLTLKYDSNGALLWSSTDNNPLPDSWNEPSAIAVDGNGNVLVTGYGGNANYYAGYYTIKYDSNGNELWSQLYNYQPGGSETNSFAKDISVDPAGNYYVTGIFDSSDNIIGTIKYDSQGNQQWVETYQSGTDFTSGFAVEAVSNNSIYVAGIHYGAFANDGLVLISYNDQGTQNWVQETNSLINSRVGHFTLDSNNLPVIAGLGKVPNSSDSKVDIRKYDSNGTLLQETSYLKPYSPTAGISGNGFTGMGLGSDQEVYIVLQVFTTAEGGIFEYSKLPLSSGNNNPDWTETFSNDGTYRSQMLLSKTDASNNTYTTSTFGDVVNGEYVTKISVIKYDPQGDIVWEKIFDPETNGYGVTGVLAKINSQGEVFVFLLPGTFENDPIRIKKYDAQGNLIWETSKNVFAPSFYTILIDDNNNIYLAGSSKENQSDPVPAFTVIKLSPSGQELWTSYHSSANASDNLYRINAGKIDSQGNLVFTGSFGYSDFFSENTSLATLKFAPNGNLLWFEPTEIAGYNESGTDLLLDQNDNIYISGTRRSTSTYIDELVLLKLNPQGQEQWSTFYEDPDRNVSAYEIEQLSTGELMVSARNYAIGQNNKVVLFKYDTDGNQIWTETSALNRFYRDMHVDDLDTAHILYQVLSSTFPERLFYSAGPLSTAGLWRVDPQGNPTPEELFFGPELSNFFPKNLVPLQNEILLIGGTLNNEAAFYQGLYFFESEHSVLGVDTPDFMNSENTWLGQNYPNPVTAKTTIPFYLSRGGEVRIDFYGLNGKYMFQAIEKDFPRGLNKVQLDLSGLRQGIYIYQLSTDGFEGSKKLIVE